MYDPQSPPEVPVLPERDEQGSGDLPTYDDLASQHGPNSRFGRWRQWIEKRAAERYADLTQEDVQRRRERGWGAGTDQGLPAATSTTSTIPQSSARPLPPTPQLHIQTDLSAVGSSTTLPPAKSPSLLPEPSPLATLIPEILSPSRLKLYQFGSRFLPHTTTPIRCLLPLLNDQILLIGHDQGLSVLDMFPREWTAGGLAEKGPADAQVRPVWEGEVVYQMSVLEMESTGQGTPQGVVLALVGPVPEDLSREQEGVRTLRMYNLASLVSLAKWAIAQKGLHTLQLGQAGYRNGKHSLSKRHKQQTSLTKGFRNLVIESPIAQPQASPDASSEPQTSYSDLADAPMYSKRLPPRPSEQRAESDESQGSWDAMDDLHDLPLLWAAHYTPLASPGSRLHNTSVLFYEYFRNENQRSRGGVLLAVATKSNIFLYEAPKGERAFRLVKEFYTPLTAKSISFVQQSVLDSMSRSSSDVSPRKSRVSLERHSRIGSVGPDSYRYPTQLSLFVVFEKKAGLIRIADSAVGEVELYEESGGLQHLFNPVTSSPMARRSRTSWDGRGFTKEHKGVWVAPVKFDLPSIAGTSRPFAQSMYVLTRGRVSHIIPHPLPPSVSTIPPNRVLVWSSQPANISCRVCTPARDENGPPPFLQLVAFGEDGIEVQEVLLSSLFQVERKGKKREDEPIRASVDIGGDTGYLCIGGHWSMPYYALTRTSSVASYDSAESGWSDQTALVERLHAHQGIYGWVQKGLEDWRVFWVGGTGAEHDEDDDDYV
ncbi:hypothetical protein DAEQUDRAFT_763780 [Daedalea quercina L-15889]|uniref:Uncharacterized protein n=1 Tax=Daedalea quercina L-15889 TaxID=1314783 RepID=A0A165S5E7_9APHY|nr:hypothetical protein DAEQUDRAFT_763780 [Daedalea quercina L-15889]